MRRPKVSLYITSYNYGDFLEQAIKSVLNQKYNDYELIIIDDKSTDNSRQIIKKYEKHPKVKVIFNERNLGLAKTCNKAINAAKGEYIMRLDADDYLNENALVTMAKFLDANPKISMVYPDYYEIDKYGKIIKVVITKKIGKESKLLDTPSLGAVTMIRRKCFDDVGGYMTNVSNQDHYGLWIKMINAGKKIVNINLPLFYYRQHKNNITTDKPKILKHRRIIKHSFVTDKFKHKKPKVLAIIPSRGDSSVIEKMPFKKIAGKPLIYYAIRAAKESSMVDKTVFVSEDEKLLKLAKKYCSVIKRPDELAKPNTKIEPTILYVIDKMKKKGFKPDIIIVLFITSPLLGPYHVSEAINTLLIYNADSIIAVKENDRFHYRHGKYGLEAMGNRKLKLERERLYEEVGSLMASKTSVIKRDNFLGKKISHVELSENEAVDIERKYDFWLCEQILKNKKKINKLWTAT